MRSLETGKRLEAEAIEPKIVTKRLVSPHPERLQYVRYALRHGWTVPHVARLTAMDPWFLYQLKEVGDELDALEKSSLETITAEEMREAKRKGISDTRLSELWKLPAREGAIKVYEKRQELGIVPVYKRVDTCAAEFESFTPYMYSTFEDEDEALPTAKKKVIILGSGPNRIGQGIEFDYCCCHAAFALARRWD